MILLNAPLEFVKVRVGGFDYIFCRFSRGWHENSLERTWFGGFFFSDFFNIFSFRIMVSAFLSFAFGGVMNVDGVGCSFHINKHGMIDLMNGVKAGGVVGHHVSTLLQILVDAPHPSY